MVSDLLVVLGAQSETSVSPTPPGQNLSLTAHHDYMHTATGDSDHVQTVIKIMIIGTSKQKQKQWTYVY